MWQPDTQGKISLEIIKKNGEKLPLMDRANVAPQGIHSAAPPTDYSPQSGDKLVIRSTGSSVFIMGLRIGIVKN